MPFAAANLLGLIEDKSNRGELLAVVRSLASTPGNNLTFSVYKGELNPPIADSMIRDQVLEAVNQMVVRGDVAGFLDAENEKGTPVKLVVELIRPKLELVIFGAGHVGQAVALIAALTGYRVIVVDDREEFASRRRLPDPRINLLVSDFESAIEKLIIGSTTAVVIVTRGHQFDELCLRGVIRSNATYIGMIGSRRRVLSVFKKLADEGISELDLQRVHAPIGLRIGARSPQEIGVAILAEIIDHLNNPEHKQRRERNVI